MAGASASSVAAAAIVLVDGGIERLDAALFVARATARAMRQNLGAAVIYNLLAVPLAVGGFVAPAMAAGLMIVSSLSVTLNAARLSFDRPMRRRRDRAEVASANQNAPRVPDLLVHRTAQPPSPAT